MAHNYGVLCIDDDSAYLFSLKIELKNHGYQVSAADTLKEGLERLEKESIDCVLLDINLPDGSGLDGLSKIKEKFPNVDIIMITAKEDVKFVVQAMRSGACNYLIKPYNIDELVAILEKLEAMRQISDRHDALVASLNPVDTRSRLLGSSPAFRELLVQTYKLRGHNANVLVLGESGTGKELLARYIHSLEENPSRRPFIAVNCAAIPESLIESELFGYEKGAFTGAVKRKLGKFELANGGDIFLDEISSLKPDLQAKILRVLQEKEIVRVGGNATVRTDFRVIAATNVDLTQMVDNNHFRMDLYHRLRVVQLTVPPLRERKEDIPMLVAYFLEKFSRGETPKKITSVALAKIQEYRWPGNIRELENVIHSVSILTTGNIIEEKHLPHWALNGCGDENRPASLPRPELALSTTYREFMRRTERAYIEHILKTCDGDKTRAAVMMNVGRTSLYTKLKELSIKEG